MTRLPPLLVGRRRGLMGMLLGSAMLQAGLSVATALLVGQLVAADAGSVAPLLGGVALALSGLGATKYAERVLAEKLGQDYVHELRGRLVGSALDADGGPSLGITIARTTNDLTSVRNWVAQGIAPLVAAAPLVTGSVTVLALVHWSLALATAVPLLLLTLMLALVSRRAYARARVLRRRRGRLAARLSDTLHARDGIRAAGGEDRERRRIDRDSKRVVAAAVARARTAGALQAAALTTAAAMAALVVVAGRLAAVDQAAVATALTVAGVLAVPLGETGRIVEFRQNFRAARRIIGPLVADRTPAAAPRRQVGQDRAARGTVQVRASRDPDAAWSVNARAGERIRLVGAEGPKLSAILHGIASSRHDEQLHVVVDGWDLATVDPRRRRELVGLAARDVPLERGTVARAVRYRRPDMEPALATRALARVGLDRVVAGLDNGEHTELRRGGAPLAPAERARLQLARAVLGDPPLLLVDHLDAALDEEGCASLRQVVAEHPGVVVFVSDVPERVSRTYRTVQLA